MANNCAANTPLTGTTGSGNFVGATSPTITTPKIVTSINDTNGNVILNLLPQSSAVNYIEVINSSGTNPASLTTRGTAGTVQMNLGVKGGVVQISDNLGAATGQLLLADQAGTASVGFKSPVSLAGTVAWTLPSADSAGAFISNGSGTMSISSSALVQRVSTETGAVATGTTVVPYDDTIPQNTEGDQYMSLAITPLNTVNKLVIDVCLILYSTVVNVMISSIFQDSTANALATAASSIFAGGLPIAVRFQHIMTAGTTSATTFKIRSGGNIAGTTTFNGAGGARLFGGVMASSIMISEYTA